MSDAHKRVAKSCYLGVISVMFWIGFFFGHTEFWAGVAYGGVLVFVAIVYSVYMVGSMHIDD